MKKGNKIWMVREEGLESWEGTPNGEWEPVSYHATFDGAEEAAAARRDDNIIDVAGVLVTWSAAQILEALDETYDLDEKDLNKVKAALGTGKLNKKLIAESLRLVEDDYFEMVKVEVTDIVLGE